jgi:WD40 repeat protein
MLMRICCDVRTGNGCGTTNRDEARVCRACGRQLDAALQLYNPGEQVQQYQIVTIIGYGKFGAVYEAQALARPSLTVALKETLHPDSIRTFWREFAALRRVEHRNLPRYYDAFIEGERGYLVMELVPGRNLQDVLNQQPELIDGRSEPLPESLVIGSYAAQLCDALHYLHTLTPPVLHRDIKPANIRVTPDGVIKLVDFGLLKYEGDETHVDIRGIGTAPYSPLEQYASSGQYTDQRSDIYSLSAVLYHMLTGQVPMSASVRRSKASDPLPPPDFYVSSISPQVSDALMRGMSLDKQERYADVVSLKRELLMPDNSVLNGRRTLRGHSGGVSSVAFSTDGQRLASASSGWSVRLWDTNEGRMLQALQGHSGRVNSVVYSPDGKTLASASSGSTVRLWDAHSGASLSMFQGHMGSVRALAWSPDGQLLASAGDDRLVQIWNLRNKRQRHTLRGHTASIYGLAWSPDGQLLASASTDRTVRIWQLSDGLTRCILQGHTDGVRTVAWNPEGTLIATGGSDLTVRIWRAEGGRLLYVLKGHTARINGLAFSPDGSVLASAGSDQKVRLWRVSDGELLGELPGHAGVVNTVAYSPDGTMFVTGSDDKTIRQWTPLEVRQIGL